MGRSLGSASACEIISNNEDSIDGCIIDEHSIIYATDAAAFECTVQRYRCSCSRQYDVVICSSMSYVVRNINYVLCSMCYAACFKS